MYSQTVMDLYCIILYSLITNLIISQEKNLIKGSDKGGRAKDDSCKSLEQTISLKNGIAGEIT